MIPKSVKKVFLLSFTSITVLTYLFLSAVVASAHDDTSHHHVPELDGKLMSTQVFEGEFLVELSIKNNSSETLKLNYLSIDDQLIVDLHRSLSAGQTIWLTESNAIAVPTNFATSGFLSLGVDVEGQDRQYINLVMN